MKCPNVLNNEERTMIFEEYRKLGDVNRQRDFRSKHAVVTNKVRTRKPKEKNKKMEDSGSESSNTDHQSKRNLTLFYLPKKQAKVKVCKTFFLNTLSVSAQVVTTVIKKKTGTTGIVAEDRRGKACKNSVISDSIKPTVRNHIDSFKRIESHYCRLSEILTSYSQCMQNVFVVF